MWVTVAEEDDEKGKMEASFYPLKVRRIRKSHMAKPTTPHANKLIF